MMIGCLAVWTGTEWRCAVCNWTTIHDEEARKHGLSSADLVLEVWEMLF